MTESEWLSSSDPQAMLRLVAENPDHAGIDCISDRKLRLLEVYLQSEIVLAVSDRTTQANLLRCIVGNPFRPVTLPGALPKHQCQSCQAPMTMEANHQHGLGLWRCTKDRHHVSRQVTIEEMRLHKQGGCPWITPTVLQLAGVAYEERPGRQCFDCANSGLAGIRRDWCDECNGQCDPDTRRIPDGTLDPLNLAVLADALEEAGCNVGGVHEYNDGGTAYWWNDAFGQNWPHLTPDRAAEHPLLAHLRSPGPHVRGCWAVDLCLGQG